jgi:RNA polymerase sigma factor (TIGR02999 family)
VAARETSEKSAALRAHGGATDANVRTRRDRLGGRIAFLRSDKLITGTQMRLQLCHRRRWHGRTRRRRGCTLTWAQPASTLATMAEPGEITLMLAAARGGDDAAWQQLVHLIYADLRQLARRILGGARRDQTLNTGALVNECYLRLAQSGAATPNDRNHFLCLAARVMRQVICDYARERLAEKRGGGMAAVTFEDLSVQEQTHIAQFVELDDALEQLARHDARQARVVECRFFAGMTDAETADALGVSVRTVARDWDAARSWLTQLYAAS